MTIDKHRDAAGRINLIHTTLNSLLIDLSKEYGTSGKVTSYILRCKERVADLRSLMDSNIILEHGHKEKMMDIMVYYQGDKL